MTVGASEISSTLQEAMKKGKLIFGQKEVMSSLKAGKLSRVIYANTLPSELEKELLYYANLNSVKTDKFDGNNVDLGIVIRRPHSVSMIGILKE